MRKILLNPGPVTLSDRVRNSLMNEDFCHREEKFASILLSVKSKLLGIYNLDSSFDAVVLSGSGTSAVEAMLSSFISNDEKVLVVSNGVYGERMAKMLNYSKKNFEIMSHTWLEETNFIKLERSLEEGNFSKLLFVHNETTTGRLNNLNKVIELCESYSVSLILDAVSSFGAEEIKFNSSALMAVASTANKCLHGITGASFVISKKENFSLGKKNSLSLYFDLFSYFEAQKEGWCPFTPSVHSLFALSEAIDELNDLGGWKARNNSYKNKSKFIRDALYTKGIKTVLSEDEYSSMISSFFLPENQTYEEIYQKFQDDGFIIYAGQGELSKKIFRICNMGDINKDDMKRLKVTINKTF
tara:strand:- start:78 stop:1148 length:1071 start_codon:yes stop_codon:yes gene_type:complete